MRHFPPAQESSYPEPDRSFIFTRFLSLAVAICLAATARATEASSTPHGNIWAGSPGSAISGNPAATTFSTGTGWLGRTLHIPTDSGITLGGLWLADSSGLIAGGSQPGRWSWNSALIIGAEIDAQKLIGWPGASFGVQFLQFDGQDINGPAGVVQGYDGIVGLPPYQRSELYQAWYLQKIIPNILQVRIGRSVPTYDFNNVLRSVVLNDSWENIPSVSGLLFTPIFVNSSILGALPGYYNSADGVTVNLTPTKNFYLNYGFYDGNGARGVQTGITPPSFNGYYFQILEAGANWTLGKNQSPGQFGAGLWYQSGVLTGPGDASQDGTGGFYLFGSQQVWSHVHHLAETSSEGKAVATPTGLARLAHESSISLFYQYGFNNSETLPVNEYFGAGVTGFGLIPHRPSDSIGFGMAWSWLNPRIFNRSSELMFQAYYQAKIFGTTFLQPTVSYIPTPGADASASGAWALSLRLTVLF